MRGLSKKLFGGSTSFFYFLNWWVCDRRLAFVIKLVNNASFLRALGSRFLGLVIFGKKYCLEHYFGS